METTKADKSEPPRRTDSIYTVARYSIGGGRYIVLPPKNSERPSASVFSGDIEQCRDFAYMMNKAREERTQTRT